MLELAYLICSLASMGTHSSDMLTYSGSSSSRFSSLFAIIYCSASMMSLGRESRLRGAVLSSLCFEVLGVEHSPTLGTNG